MVFFDDFDELSNRSNTSDIFEASFCLSFVSTSGAGRAVVETLDLRMGLALQIVIAGKFKTAG